MEFVKFSALEEKVKGLIQEQVVLKKRNQELEGLLRQKEIDLEETREKIRGLEEERDAIRTKVDSLLDLLQDIQISQ